MVIGVGQGIIDSMDEDGGISPINAEGILADIIPNMIRSMMFVMFLMLMNKVIAEP